MSNLKLKSNIQELYKIIREENFKRDEAIEFLDAINEGVQDLETELDDNDDTIRKLEEQVTELENNQDEYSLDGAKEIETPLGKVYVLNENGNLKIEDEVERFEKILKHI